ncbi:unnamed protein product [Ectocarpus sp. 8 AP-2014]
MCLRVVCSQLCVLRRRKGGPVTPQNGPVRVRNTHQGIDRSSIEPESLSHMVLLAALCTITEFRAERPDNAKVMCGIKNPVQQSAVSVLIWAFF